MSKDIKKEDIEEMSYVDFMSFLGEINRPPGGKVAIKQALDYIGVDSSSIILDVGCNTGFCSLESARLKKCKVYGIDISPNMIEKAREVLTSDTEQIKDLIEYCVVDCKNLPFKNEEFDHVISGGSIAFIDDIPASLEEIRRVLKTWGFFGDINFYYKKSPPKELIQKLNNLMSINIIERNKEDWIEMYKHAGFEVFNEFSHTIDKVSEKKVEEYVEESIKHLPTEVKESSKLKLQKIMTLFNENHEYLSYSIFILRKRKLYEEPFLFKS